MRAKRKILIAKNPPPEPPPAAELQRRRSRLLSKIQAAEIRLEKAQRRLKRSFNAVDRLQASIRRWRKQIE